MTDRRRRRSPAAHAVTLRGRCRRPVAAGGVAAAAALAALLSSPTAAPAAAQGPARTVDVAALRAGVDPLVRVSASADGDFIAFGIFGTPVAAGGDVDGDGRQDYAIAHILKDPVGPGRRPFAGEVNLVFGDGTVSRAIDLGRPKAGRALEIQGAGEEGVPEMAGSEIWIGDVTGDGLAELLVCRQNFSFRTGSGRRFGAGALSILVGGPALRALAEQGRPLDLASPPAGVEVLTLVGPHPMARLGVWARVGDVDGDGIGDVIVAADQETVDGAPHQGAVYVVRGGPHLARRGTVDLGVPAGPLAGHVARLVPGGGEPELHLGATLQVADLDGDGRGEVLVGATLNRAGAAIGPFGFDPRVTHGSGGPPRGRAYVVWGDQLPPPPWPAGLRLTLGTAAATTVVAGGARNVSFGEEVIGGDFDGDRRAELFVGDLVGDGTAAGNRPVSGVGYVFYDAASLRGRRFAVDRPPADLAITTILGPSAGAIGADTAAVGDFDGDGFEDLALGSPHDSPRGRIGAGSIQVFFGRPGRWPARIDTAPGAFPPAAAVRITEVHGAVGTLPGVFTGDTLCYSAAAADIDRDGRTDLVTNEMTGNGTTPRDLDVGTLLVISGGLL